MATSPNAVRRGGQSGVLPSDRTREQIRGFYDRISRYYDVLAERSEAHVQARALQLLSPLPGEAILEIGPGTVLKGLIRKINPELSVHNIQKPEDIETLSI